MWSWQWNVSIVITGEAVCARVRVSGLCPILNTIPERATGETQEKYETFVTFNFLLQSPRYDTLSPPMTQQHPVGQGLLIVEASDHTQTHHTL